MPPAFRACIMADSQEAPRRRGAPGEESLGLARVLGPPPPLRLASPPSALLPAPELAPRPPEFRKRKYAIPGTENFS